MRCPGSALPARSVPAARSCSTGAGQGHPPRDDLLDCAHPWPFGVTAACPKRVSREAGSPPIPAMRRSSVRPARLRAAQFRHLGGLPACRLSPHAVRWRLCCHPSNRVSSHSYVAQSKWPSPTTARAFGPGRLPAADALSHGDAAIAGELSPPSAAQLSWCRSAYARHLVKSLHRMPGCRQPVSGPDASLSCALPARTSHRTQARPGFSPSDPSWLAAAAIEVGGGLILHAAGCCH